METGKYDLPPARSACQRCGPRAGGTNILTVAWTGTVCTNPPMVYISVRPERYSYQMIRESGEFVINLTTEKLAWATDFCGVKSGKDVDKWEKCRLTRGKPARISAPVIEECPVNIECSVAPGDGAGLTSHVSGGCAGGPGG